MAHDGTVKSFVDTEWHGGAPSIQVLRRALVLDLAAVAGLASALYGLRQVYAPLPWIVGGLLVALGAVRAARTAP